MNFYKNELINKILDEFFVSWAHTVDVAEYVDEKFLKKIDNYLAKNMFKKFKEVEIYNLLELESKGIKLSLLNRMRVYFSGLRELFQIDKLGFKKKENKKLKEKKKNVKSKKKKVIKSSS